MQVIEEPPRPDFCSHCNTHSFDEQHWYWKNEPAYKAGGSWRCRQAKRAAGKRRREKIKNDPDQLRRQREYQAAYALKHPDVRRYKAMVCDDRSKGRTVNISRKDYCIAVASPCYYCDKKPAGGLDRIDSSLGHVWDNVVPCCEKCNNILGDLPAVAKEHLKDGLRRIHNESLLDNWEIPTKRKKQND